MLVLPLPMALFAYYLRPKVSARLGDSGTEVQQISSARLPGNSDVLWIDASVDRRAAPVQGIRRLNLEEWDSLLPEVLEAWEPGMTIVVQDSSEGTDAINVARRLLEALPDENIFVLDERNHQIEK